MEIWKDVVGYEGIAEVSNLGNVRTIPRIDYANRKLKGKILAQTLTIRGYKEVTLYNGSAKTFKVHQLVAKAFLENPFNFKQVNHINAIKTDNRIENLEWCSPKQNTDHAKALKLYQNGEESHLSKLTQEQVIEIRQSSLKGTELAQIYNVTPSNICYIRKNKTWK